MENPIMALSKLSRFAIGRFRIGMRAQKTDPKSVEIFFQFWTLDLLKRMYDVFSACKTDFYWSASIC